MPPSIITIPGNPPKNPTRYCRVASDDDVLLEIFAERVAHERGNTLALFDENHKRKLKALLRSDEATARRGARVRLAIWSSYLEVAEEWLPVWSLRALLFVFICVKEGWLSNKELDNLVSDRKKTSKASATSSKSKPDNAQQEVRKHSVNSTHAACLVLMDVEERQAGPYDCSVFVLLCGSGRVTR